MFLITYTVNSRTALWNSCCRPSRYSAHLYSQCHALPPDVLGESLAELWPGEEHQLWSRRPYLHPLLQLVVAKTQSMPLVLRTPSAAWW
jgi:hypothetical protein